MKVVSFCIYGSNEKYCLGLLENINIIKKKLPDFYVFIYVGNDVPENYISLYSSYDKVKLIYTNRIGHDNMINRFFAIDEDNVELMIVRDADSRIHNRDLWCINHFIESHFSAHTIRDHPYHVAKIMGGLWGLKKGLLNDKIKNIYSFYNNKGSVINQIQHDQYFLKDAIYNLIKKNLIVYINDYKLCLENGENICLIPFPIINNDFCGQVVEYKNSISYKVYDFNK
jgi:hypothetical protein